MFNLSNEVRLGTKISDNNTRISSHRIIRKKNGEKKGENGESTREIGKGKGKKRSIRLWRGSKSRNKNIGNIIIQRVKKSKDREKEGDKGKR